MKILITGGTTFVSRFTAEYFVKKGHEITILNRGSKPQPQGTRVIFADRMAIGDRLKGLHFDAVLDITAYTGEHVRSLFDSQCTFDDYILLSSSAVYPETNRQPFSEDQSTGENSVWGDYGLNKIKAEEAALSCSDMAYILRPPYLYGIYNNLYREAFVFDCAEKGRPFFIPESNMTLQFFHVKDLCLLIERILNHHPAQHILNAANERSVSSREWARLCYRAAGKTPEIISVPSIIPQRNYFPFYPYEYALDVSGMKTLLPVTVDLFEGIREEYRWYRDHRESVDHRKPYAAYIDRNLLHKGG